jgi:hypothetical protein
MYKKQRGCTSPDIVSPEKEVTWLEAMKAGKYAGPDGLSERLPR